MIGLLLNPTKADLSPEGLLPHESAMQPRARIRTSAVASPLVPPTRLKRILNRWMAAAIAYRERQAALLALHRAGDRDLNNKRIYRGPIDDALEKSRAASPAQTPQAVLNKAHYPNVPHSKPRRFEMSITMHTGPNTARSRHRLACNAAAHPLLWRPRLSDFLRHVSLRGRLRLGICRAQDRRQGHRNRSRPR